MSEHSAGLEKFNVTRVPKYPLLWVSHLLTLRKLGEGCQGMGISVIGTISSLKFAESSNKGIL